MSAKVFIKVYLHISAVDIAVEIEHPKKDEICSLLLNHFQDYIRRRKEKEAGTGFVAKVNRILAKLLNSKLEEKSVNFFINTHMGHICRSCLKVVYFR